jgi:hypothetical protein
MAAIVVSTHCTVFAVISIIFMSRFLRVLTMVYNTQNYWVLGFVYRPVFWKLENNVPRWGGETPTLLGSLERANLSHWSGD